MASRRRTKLRSAFWSAIAIFCVAVVLDAAAPSPANAHGAATQPGSRTYLCRLDGTHPTGDIVPNNPACAQAVAMGGKQPLWDWFGVLRGDGQGRTVGYIPDGQLCSGGDPKYAGYDQPRADWPYTSLTSGGELTIRYNAWAAHPGEFRLYVTRDGFDPTQPLRWQDLEPEPFSVWTQSQPNGYDDANNSPDYQWQARLPQKSGQHIIYSIWTRSDSQETFYGCSDVRFDGGSGEVYGLGSTGQAVPAANPTQAPSQSPSPSPSPPPSASAPPSAPASAPPSSSSPYSTPPTSNQASGVPSTSPSPSEQQGQTEQPQPLDQSEQSDASSSVGPGTSALAARVELEPNQGAGPNSAAASPSPGSDEQALDIVVAGTTADAVAPRTLGAVPLLLVGALIGAIFGGGGALLAVRRQYGLGLTLAPVRPSGQDGPLVVPTEASPATPTTPPAKPTDDSPRRPIRLS